MGYYPQVGDIVYESYSPQRPGLILGVVTKDDRDEMWDLVEVMWKTKDRKRTVVKRIMLKKLERLIDDHQKKLDGHKKRMTEMEKIKDGMREGMVF